MTISSLPDELLVAVIEYTSPQAFENLAVTCKRFWTLCEPYVEQHNKLRLEFRDFTYHGNGRPDWQIRSAFDLLARIAVDPVIAQHITHADFEADNLFYARRGTWKLAADDPIREAVIHLLLGSQYLKAVDGDPHRYNAQIMFDVGRSQYSQNAAQFLLTLLPNVESLILPSRWNPATARPDFMTNIVGRANEGRASDNSRSLAQLTRFKPPPGHGGTFHLGWITPFLALPNIRSVSSGCCISRTMGRFGVLQATSDSIETHLVSAHLYRSDMDAAGVISILQNAPALKSFRYSHAAKIRTERGPRWHLPSFVSAIEQCVGSHLEELSISIRDLHGVFTSGGHSMQGFERLRQLELPLEYVSIDGNATMDEASWSPQLCDLIPSSVCRLSLISSGGPRHAQVLEGLFRGFAGQQVARLPVLEELHLYFPEDADEAFRTSCNNVVRATGKVGIVTRWTPLPDTYDFTWIGDG